MLSTSQPIVPPIQSDATLWFASVLFLRRAPQLHRVFWQIISGHSEEFESGRRRMLRWFMYNPRSTNQSRSPQPLTWLQRQHKKCLQLPKLNYINFFFSGLRHFFVINCGKIIQHPLFQTVRCKKSDSKKVLPSAKIPYWQSTQMGSDAKKTLSRNSADCVAPVLALERTSVHQQMFLQWFHAPFWFSRFGWRQLVDLSLVVLEFRLFFFCLSRMWFQKVNSVHRRSWFVEPHCC